MGKRLRTSMADKVKVKRVTTTTKRKRVTKGQQYQTEIKTRSGFESKVCDLLDKYKIDFEYENKEKRVNYTVPAKERRYLCDFIVTCKETGVEYYIETKGRFVELSERMKYLHIQEQNPHIKLGMCFMNPNLKISKNSKTTYKMWFDSKGISNIDFKQLDKIMKEYKKTGKISI